MGNGKMLRRIFALMLTVVMLLGCAIPAGASFSDDASTGTTFEKVSNDAVSVAPSLREAQEEQEDEPLYADTDNVRVSIVMEEKSTIEKGFSTKEIAGNSAAMNYRAGLQAEQDALASDISTEVLGGKALDVVWNLTLAANIISANVQYGDIDAIKAMDGVADVFVENRYEPDVASVNSDDPNMATSSEMVGSNVAYAAGYTGAGSRIAIIDTGTDDDHQSFAAAAYEHSLAQLAASKGVSYEAYVASLDLLDADEIASVASQLNANISAANTYLTSKLPYAYNYVDKNYQINHDNDTEGEHGSHVAGIATANSYISDGKGGFVSALDSVLTQGVAPDAQLITMKVFGKGGGAYDSDYMAAIEDAIVLGCDSVNLSLGSGNPGSSISAGYQDVMDKLAETDTVVTMSCGNSGYWIENSANGIPYLYSDDVSLDMVGSPGSFTNSLAVASVDNWGGTGPYLSVDNMKVFFSETTGYSNAPILNLDTNGSGTDYDYVFIDGIGDAASYEGIDVTGKVVFVSRGSTSFFEKHDEAGKQGAIACVVYNNQAGTINMDLTDSSTTIPCVSITLADGQAILAASTKAADGSYTGRVSVNGTAAVSAGSGDYYVMSAFSSWGVPGDLSIKPEITAPGGNIYSVNGSVAGGKAYMNMSGTSMSAPQVTGMAALVAQYINENNLKTDSLSVRQLANSLLMSTATPLFEEAAAAENYDNYYSILNQGAGLANVGAAVSAKSYVLVDGQPDGKVKVELGDDPARTGVYSFSFTLNNLTGTDATYNLSGDVFSQDVFAYGGNIYLDTYTARYPAVVSFGAGNTVTVPANGSVKVNATITLGDDTKEFFDTYYTNGAYVEAFVYATEQSSADGAIGTIHSIPVLGFYGNWTDASMYEVGVLSERWYGTEDRAPYMNSNRTNYLTLSYAGESGEYYFVGNPVAEDEEYIPERNAFNNEAGNKFSRFAYSVIRNAGSGAIIISDAETGDVYKSTNIGIQNSAYYYSNGGAWRNTAYNTPVDWAGTDSTGVKLDEGTIVDISLVLAPEYYADEDNKYDWSKLAGANGELGEGAYLGATVTIDNTAPEVLDMGRVENDLVVTAQDNRHIAAIVIYNADGSRQINSDVPNQTEVGVEYEATIDMSDAYGSKFVVALYDYAMNVSAYLVELEEPFNETDFTDDFLMFDVYNQNWVAYEDGVLSTVTNSSSIMLAAEYSSGYVFSIDSEGVLYVAEEDNLDVLTEIADLGVTFPDLAYSAKTAKLYGLPDGYTMYEIDVLTGEMNELGTLNIPNGTNLIACDDDGTFYSIEFATGALYKYTIDTLGEPELVGQTNKLFNYVQALEWSSVDQKLYWTHYHVGLFYSCDLNADGRTDAADAQLILDYVSGNLDTIDETLADINKDGKVTSADAHILLNVKAAGVLQANLLCVDPETAETSFVCELGEEMTCLIIPDGKSEAWAEPTDEVSKITVNTYSLTIFKSTAAQLKATVSPWTLNNRGVFYTSSNESIATVNANGFVTGVGVGECEITVSAACDPSKFVTVAVEVTTIDKTLNGVVWDEDGAVWWSEFNTTTLPSYTKLTGTANDVRIATSAELNGTLYGANLDEDTSTSSLYTIDPETFESTLIGGANIFHADLAPAPNLDDGMLLGLYGYYVTMVDPATGDYLGAWDYSGTDGSTLVGIAYLGSVLNTNYNDYIDVYAIIDSAGSVYQEAFMDMDGKYYYFNGPEEGKLLATGLEIDVNCYNSAYYDGEYLFWSRYSANENDVDIIAMDIDYTGAVYNVGSFANDVWPVGGLTQLDATSTNGNATTIDNAMTDADIADSSEATTDSLAAFNMSIVAKSGAASEFTAINTTATEGITAGTMSTSSEQGESTASIIVNVEDSTNGLLDIKYDAKYLTLLSVEDTLIYDSINSAASGTVTVAYASAAATTGTVKLTFSFDPETVPRYIDIDVNVLEAGNGYPNTNDGLRLTLRDVVIVNPPVGPTDPVDPVAPVDPVDDFYVDVPETSWFRDAIEYVDENDLMNGVSDTHFAPNAITNRAMAVTVLYRIAGEPAVTGDSPFVDVVAGAWYENAVIWASQNGIAKGVADDLFNPEAEVTREELAVFFYRYAELAGEDASVRGDLSVFADGDTVHSWAKEELSWAVGTGLVEGTDAGLAPLGKATRAQLATMLMRYCEA